MSRILALAALLLFMAISPSWADIFKCQQPDGTIIFTDDPGQASADCKMERVTDLPILGIIRDSAVVSTPSATLPAPNLSKGKTAADAAKSFETFESEVTQLVEQASSARRRAFRSAFVADEQKARRELAELKTQASDLQGEIQKSGLRSAEKQTLSEKLATITD